MAFNLQFFLSHKRFSFFSIVWFLFRKLPLFKNAALTKSTLTAALSHKNLATCLSQKNSHHAFQSKFAQPPMTKNRVLKLNLEYQYPKFWFNRVFVIFEFISLSYEFWSSPFSIVLHHYLGLGFEFLVLFSLSVFHSVLDLFSIFFYLTNLIRVNKLISTLNIGTQTKKNKKTQTKTLRIWISVPKL